MSEDTYAEAAVPACRVVYRHTLPLRIMHWINVICMTLLLMSGLQIFNAHPALYWGERSDFERPALAIGALSDANGEPKGVVQIAGHTIPTDGVLGRSRGPDGQILFRAFPSWATLPGPQSLALGRRWHFFFAWIFVLNGLAYLGYGLARGHFRRDLLPTRAELRGIGHVIREHLRLRFPRGDAARRYNVLQQLTYLLVIFVLLPGIIVAGLAMSPQLDADFPFLLIMFGGRQSARTAHFIAAFLLLGFAFVHVGMVIASGAWNNMRSMVTGWYAVGQLRTEEKPDAVD